MLTIPKKSPRFIIIHSFASGMDTFFDYVLIAYLILIVHKGTPIDAALIAVSFTLSGSLFSVKFGHICDQLPLKGPMVLSAIALLVAAISICFIENKYLILLFVFLKSSARSYISVAFQKFIVTRYDDDEQLHTNSFLNFISNASKLAAPLLFTILASAGLSTLTTVVPVLLTTVILANISISRYPEVSVNGSKTKGTSNRLSVKELFVKIRNAESGDLLIWGIVLYSFSLLGVYLSDDLLALLMTNVGGDEGDIGLFILLIGAGGLLGSVIVPRVEKHFQLTTIFVCSLIFDAICFFSYSLVPIIAKPVATMLFIGFIMGVGTSFGAISFRTLLYINVDKNLSGKAIGLVQSIASGVVLVMPVAGGILAASTTIQAPFLGTAIILCLLVLVYLARYPHETNDKKERVNVE